MLLLELIYRLFYDNLCSRCQPCRDRDSPLCLLKLPQHLECLIPELKYELLVELTGRFEADLLESFLEAHSVDVELFQKSAGQHVYPVTIDGLGSAQVFVPKAKLEDAIKLLDEFDLQE